MAFEMRELTFDEFIEACNMYGEAVLTLKNAHPNMSNKEILKMAEVVIRALKKMKED